MTKIVQRIEQMFLMTYSDILDLDRYIFGQIYNLKVSIIFIIQCIERLLCKVVTRVRCFSLSDPDLPSEL